MRHRSQRVPVALARAPGAELRREIRRGLPGKRRIAAPDTFSPRAVTSCAGLDAAFGIAFKVESRSSAIRYPVGRVGGHRQRGVIGRETLARRPIRSLGDPSHLRMASLPLREEFHLPREISRIEPCKARREVAVAFAPQAVAGHAGCFRPGVTPAERNHLAGGFEAIVDRLGGCAGTKRGRQGEER